MKLALLGQARWPCKRRCWCSQIVPLRRRSSPVVSVANTVALGTLPGDLDSPDLSGALSSTPAVNR